MTQAAITTASRRIVRELNARRAGFTLYFDADGRRVDEKYGTDGFGPRYDTYYVEFATGERGRKVRASQRAVQDVLDALAAALTVEPHLGRARDLADSLLGAWGRADERGTARPTIAEHVKVVDAVERELADKYATDYASLEV